MSGITLAMAACLAGQRDWRRVTLATDAGNNNIGFSSSVPYGSMTTASRTFRGSLVTNVACGLINGGCNIVFGTQGLPMNFFGAIELGISNGQSRILIPDPTTGGLTGFSTGVGFTQWSWGSGTVPNGSIWVLSDAGKTLPLGLL